MDADQRMEHVAAFCGNSDCGCPELLIDHDAPQGRRIVITDDFGQRIQTSTEQLRALVADIRSGALDHVLVAP